MKLLFKILLPVLILVGSVFAAKTIRENRPEPFTRPQFPKVTAVEATKLKASDYPVIIRSQGTVQPSQSSTLVAEATGTIISLADNFVVGGTFAEGDVLFQVDERDYSIALTQAKANLAQVTAALEEETARGQIAADDWKSLGRRGEASPMTLRLPQLSAAKANQASARAQVEQAELELERTRFHAPFDGQVLEASVDLGQFVSRGTRLGQVYASSSVDVKLPLSSRQLGFLDVPKPGSASGQALPSITLTASDGNAEQSWIGKVVRTEGVDTATQQLNVIARVNQLENADKQALRIGQYVKASISGQVLKDVFVLPRTALREDKEVLLVTADNTLQRREVNVAWFDEQTVAINDGLENGAILVTTALSTVTNGTPVRATVDGVAPPEPVRKGGEGRRGERGKGAGGEGKGQRGERGKGEGGEGKGQRGERGQGAGGEGKGQRGERGQGAGGEGKGQRGERGQGAGGEGKGQRGERGQGAGGERKGQRGERGQGAGGEVQRGVGKDANGTSESAERGKPADSATSQPSTVSNN